MSRAAASIMAAAFALVSRAEPFAPPDMSPAMAVPAPLNTGGQAAFGKALAARERLQQQSRTGTTAQPCRETLTGSSVNVGNITLGNYVTNFGTIVVSEELCK